MHACGLSGNSLSVLLLYTFGIAASAACPPDSASSGNGTNITDCVCDAGFSGPVGGPCTPTPMNVTRNSTHLHLMIMLSGGASLVVNQSAVTKHVLDWKKHSEDFVLAAWIAVGGIMPLPFEFFYDWRETTVSDTSINLVNLSFHVRALGDIDCPSHYNETSSWQISLRSAPPITGDICAQILDSDMSTGFVSGAFMYAQTNLIVDIITYATQVDGIYVNRIYSLRSHPYLTNNNTR